MYTEFKIGNKDYKLISLLSKKIFLEIDKKIQDNIYQKLLQIIIDLKLNISNTNKNGNPKNTQQLGKEIIIAIGNIKQNDEEKYFQDVKNKNELNPEIQFKAINTEHSLIDFSAKYFWKRLYLNDKYFEFNSIKLKYSEDSHVYRWYIQNDDGEVMLYIGETKNFTKRLNQYIKPGITQDTNIRLNSDFTTLANQGYKIFIDVLDLHELVLDKENLLNHDLVNLNLKEFRRLFENYFIIEAKLKNIKVLNK